MTHILNFNRWKALNESRKLKIYEAVEDCCKKSNPDLNLVELYWSDTSKTEEQKVQEINQYIQPVFDKAKQYYLTYIEGEWFTKKIKEKISSGSVEGSQNPMTKWEDAEKSELISYINSIKVVNQLQCESRMAGYVNPSVPSEMNICIKTLCPTQDTGFLYDTIIHELKHGISAFFKSRGVKFLPNDAGGNITISASVPASYGNDADENSSRIQSLRIALGVDDMVSIENLVDLLKKNLEITHDDQKCRIEYDSSIMKIYVPILDRTKKSDSLLRIGTDKKRIFKITINGTSSSDFLYLFNVYSKHKGQKGEEDLIEIDLNKLFNYVQQFAKNDGSGSKNPGVKPIDTTDYA